MLRVYLLSTLVLLILILPPFLKDSTAPKTSLASWGFFLLVLGLSPITLPTVLYRRGQSWLKKSKGFSPFGWEALITRYDR
jgi:hypothetical protein